MKKVVLYIATSIDGYIATKEGNIDWLPDPEQGENNNHSFGYEEFYDSIDTTLMGYATYKKIIGFGVPFPYFDKKNFIFSRNHQKKENLPVEFIRPDIISFVKKLKTGKGKHIWLIGGGQINGILLDNDLIDEMIVTVIPVVLGNGIPLFSSTTQIKRFKQVEVQTFGGSISQIRYLKI
jgi:dihydrofolate reductase